MSFDNPILSLRHRLHQKTQSLLTLLPPIVEKNKKVTFDEQQLSSSTADLLSLLLRYCVLYGVLSATPTVEEVCFKKISKI